MDDNSGSRWASLAHPDMINANIDRLDFKAWFCSVFDECRVASYQDFATVDEVAGCTPGPGSFKE